MQIERPVRVKGIAW